NNDDEENADIDPLDTPTKADSLRGERETKLFLDLCKDLINKRTKKIVASGANFVIISDTLRTVHNIQVFESQCRDRFKGLAKNYVDEKKKVKTKWAYFNDMAVLKGDQTRVLQQKSPKKILATKAKVMNFKPQRHSKKASNGDYAELPQRPPSVDIEGWKRLGDPTFKKQFRMDRTLFEVLVVEVGTHMAATNRLIRQGKPIDEALMNTIWTLANPDCFRSTGGTFGVLGGSIHNQYKTMIQVLEELKSKYIRWPSALEQEVIARELYGYPGVIGCIDGSFISTYKPMDEPQRYINRHHEYSVIVHAVCDHNLLFRDIYV
ncbi:hypothetical protein FOCC_FOCC008309, partial [Frankliniella occidentalis]